MFHLSIGGVSLAFLKLFIFQGPNPNMELMFWKKKKKKRTKKRRTNRRYKANAGGQSQRRDDEILLKLDAIMTFLRKHDLDVKEKLDRMAVARRILKETNLDEIVRQKLSQGMRPRDIVVECVSKDVCSRATAYRYVSRQLKLLKVSITSQ